MPQEIERPQLLRLNDHLSEHLGLTFPSERISDFQHKIVAASKEFGMEPAECVDWLLSAPLTEAQIHTLSYHLTIGETYFFRDPRTFEILEDEVLNKLIRQRRSGHKYLRIWSAGCCSGEEPYSLAMLLTRMIPDIETWRITILGTDINAQFIKKAQHGTYEPWSFRITSPEMKNRFFTQSKSKYQIDPAIKKMVHFKQMNLVDPRVPEGIILSSFDLIFCRNVLMYFHRDQAMRVLNRLHDALTDSGVLVSTPFELSAIPEKLFERLPYKSAVLLGKRNHNHTFVEIPEPALPLKSTNNLWSKHEQEQPVKAKKPAAKVNETIEQKTKPTPETTTDAAASHTALQIAKTHAHEGAYGQALQALEQSLEADKLNHHAYFIRATILQAQGNLTEAIKALRQALFIEPEFIMGEFHLASLLLRLGKLQESRKRFQNAITLLSQYNGDEIVPEGEGMTAKVLGQIITSLQKEIAQ